MSGMFWSLSAPTGLITDVTRPSFRMSVTENLRKCRVNEKSGTKTSENVAFSCTMAGTIQHRIYLLPKVSDPILITVILCPPSNLPLQGQCRLSTASFLPCLQGHLEETAQAGDSWLSTALAGDSWLSLTGELGPQRR